MDSPPGPLGAATYTYLYSRTLIEALRSLAAAGLTRCELTATHPHIDDCRIDAALARTLRAETGRLGLSLVSFNPTFLDLNAASLNARMRAETMRQLRTGLQSCHDLEIPLLVLFPGRRHVLAPAPMEMVRGILLEELHGLLELAQRLGVTIGLENGPTLFLDRARDVAAVIDELGHPALRMVFDVANSYMVEDPVDALADALPHVALLHLSDTNRSRWAHAPVGQGEVPFPDIAGALRNARYRGISVMEIVDLDQPDTALHTSANALEEWGWSRTA